MVDPASPAQVQGKCGLRRCAWPPWAASLPTVARVEQPGTMYSPRLTAQAAGATGSCSCWARRPVRGGAAAQLILPGLQLRRWSRPIGMTSAENSRMPTSGEMRAAPTLGKANKNLLADPGIEKITKALAEYPGMARKKAPVVNLPQVSFPGESI